MIEETKEQWRLEEKQRRLRVFVEQVLKEAGELAEDEQEDNVAGRRAVVLLEKMLSSDCARRFSLLFKKACEGHVQAFFNADDPVLREEWNERYGVKPKNFKSALSLILRTATTIEKLNDGSLTSPASWVSRRGLTSGDPRLDSPAMATTIAGLPGMLRLSARYFEEQHEWTLDHPPAIGVGWREEAGLIESVKRLTGKLHYDDIGRLLRIGSEILVKNYYDRSTHPDLDIDEKRRTFSSWEVFAEGRFTGKALKRRYRSVISANAPRKRRGRPRSTGLLKAS